MSVCSELLQLGQVLQIGAIISNWCRTACNFIEEETLAQVFSCEFCKISKKTFSYRTTSEAASIFQCIFPYDHFNQMDYCNDHLLKNTQVFHL